MEYFGTENVGNIPALTMKQRLGRCYSLAGYALALGTAPHSAVLVHGTIRRLHTPVINHAWLILPNADQVWEPAQGRIWNAYTWQLFAHPHINKMYNKSEIHAKIVEFQHWGPWHEHSSGVQLPAMIDTDVPGV